MSCAKQNEYLSKVPSQSLTLPNSLTNIQELLNRDQILNKTDPGSSLEVNDEIYITNSSYLAAESSDQNLYTWQPDPYPTTGIADWDQCYSQVSYANIALDNLAQLKVSGNDLITYNQIRGEALFFRAKAFFNLLQIFSLPYDSTKADKLLGIPLKLNSDLTIVSTRSSEKDCYNQVIQDLQTTVTLLPQTAQVLTMPNVFAAHGFLARVYLAMGNYDAALSESNKALQINDSLTDYNTFPTPPTDYYLTSSSLYPLIEDQFHSCTSIPGLGGFSTACVDSLLYQSYDSTDIRKTAFFMQYSNAIRWKGSYEFKQFGVYYDGIATDEMYLIRSECRARSGDLTGALSDLNALLVKRYISGTFVPIASADQTSLLQKIILERRKELYYRGTRWMDLRRLNFDSRFAKTLTRTVNGSTYILPPGDLRYAFLIPYDEINVSHITQNQR